MFCFLFKAQNCVETCIICVWNCVPPLRPSKFPLPSSYLLGMKVCWRYKEIFPQSTLTESMNDGGDCRTAPATPGLLITYLPTYWKVRLLFGQLLAPVDIFIFNAQKTCFLNNLTFFQVFITHCFFIQGTLLFSWT